MIPIHKPYIKRKELDSVLTCLVSDKIGPGDMGRQMMDIAASYLELPGGTAFREPSHALSFALDVMGIGKGAKVVISPLSPAYYLHVLQKREVEVLFADVECDTPCISVSAVESLLPRTPDLLLVHSPLGLLPDWEGLAEIGLPVIEDITASVGGHNGYKKCGSWGRVVICSMEEGDMVTTGGGALVFGRTKQILSAIKQGVQELPKSVLLSDINAALGVVQWQSIESAITKRREIASLYVRSLSLGKHKAVLQKGESENNNSTFPVLLSGGMSEVRKYAAKKEVETAPAFGETVMAAMDMEQDRITSICPHAVPFLLRCLLFPLYPALSKQQVETVSRVISTLP